MHRIKGEAEKSIAALELATDLNPSFTIAYHELGVGLALMGKPDEAIASFEKAMRLSPHDPMMSLFFSGVGLAHAMAGRDAEAVEWSKRSVNRKADWYLPYLVLAASYANLGRMQEARSAIEDLLHIRPQFSLTAVKLLLAAAEPGVAELAVESLRKAGLKE
jgi:adenylate cyclase